MMKQHTHFRRAIAVSIGCACFIPLNAHADTDKQPLTADPTFTVEWVGAMKTVHRDGDASPETKLEPLARVAGGFAIGPVAGLRGEITVVEGEAHIARVIDGEEHVAEEWDVEAPFLVHGHVDAWVETPLPETVKSLTDLEAWLPKAAEANGIDTAKPFPFKIETTDAAIDFHVISNDEPGYLVTRPHRELMQFYALANEPATLIGVHSTEHAGVFTHHGSSTHIHLISHDKKHSGHVDAVTFGNETKLLLPSN